MMQTINNTIAKTLLSKLTPLFALSTLLCPTFASEAEENLQTPKANINTNTHSMIDVLRRMRSLAQEANKSVGVSDDLKKVVSKERQKILYQLNILASKKWDGIALLTGGNGTDSLVTGSSSSANETETSTPTLENSFQGR